jgi:hypothetical protein
VEEEMIAYYKDVDWEFVDKYLKQGEALCKDEEEN